MTTSLRAHSVRLHFVQDVATPHNNVLLEALDQDPDVDLWVWYAALTHPQYAFSPELASAIKPPIIYGKRWPSLRLIARALLWRRERLFIIGWMNRTTRVLIPLLWITRRRYNMWFDLPADETSRSGTKHRIRELYYGMLRRSTAMVFVVGGRTAEYFRDRGFAADRIVDLPIFVPLGAPNAYRGRRTELRDRYGVGSDDLFVVAGSRLVPEKGFDILIDAISRLDEPLRRHLRVLIVGKGPQEDMLRMRISRESLEQQIFILPWMESEDFRAHIAAGDVLVHPARFDAFGGATLTALALGVPVIGSREGGSTVDRIEHGQNGWLYDAEDVDALKDLLAMAYRIRTSLRAYGARARATAERYGPARGARTVVERSI